MTEFSIHKLQNTIGNMLFFSTYIQSTMKGYLNFGIATLLSLKSVIIVALYHLAKLWRYSFLSIYCSNVILHYVGSIFCLSILKIKQIEALRCKVPIKIRKFILKLKSIRPQSSLCFYSIFHQTFNLHIFNSILRCSSFAASRHSSDMQYILDNVHNDLQTLP